MSPEIEGGAGVRKLAYCAGGFSAAIFLAHFLLPARWVLPGALAAVVLALVTLLLPGQTRRRVMVALLSAAIGFGWYAAAEVLHAKPVDILAKAKSFTAELKEARQSVERMKEKILHSDVERFLYASKNIGGIKVITTTRTDLEAGDLRKLGDFLRDKDPDTVAVLATATESKVTFVAVCGKNAVAKGIRAGDLVRAVSAVAGGKGGGKPDSAMGGGSEVLKIDDALAVVDDFVAEKLGL